jgi:hypothetical protein
VHDVIDDRRVAKVGAMPGGEWVAGDAGEGDPTIGGVRAFARAAARDVIIEYNYVIAVSPGEALGLDSGAVGRVNILVSATVCVGANLVSTHTIRSSSRDLLACAHGHDGIGTGVELHINMIGRDVGAVEVSDAKRVILVWLGSQGVFLVGWGLYNVRGGWGGRSRGVQAGACYTSDA